MFQSISRGLVKRGLVTGASAVFALATLVACDRGPYIEVNGERLSESDLKDQRPEVYANLKKTYNRELLGNLRQLAFDRLFELEAKETGAASSKDYIDKISAGAETPSEAEVRAAYDDWRGSQGFDGRSFEEMGGLIANHMRDQNKQRLIMNEFQRLQEKYGFEEFDDAPVAPRVELTVGDSEPIRMSPQAKVTVVEFTDFECPYCQKAQSTVSALRAQFGDRVRWVVKDFPLSFHPNAMGAHIAANCVLRQDRQKYWEFFDQLFAENRPRDVLAPARLRSSAQSLGIDMAKYDACLTDPSVQAEIQANIEEGGKAGVNGTPSFFINGAVAGEGMPPLPAFKKLIEDELKKVGG